MSMVCSAPTAQAARLDDEQIRSRLGACPRLPSLGSINSALQELLHADQRYITQIAEIIRRDPSLTARLLRLVNSVYYGLSSPIHHIEEAVFYLGVQQIRQLAMATPIIEEFQKLAGPTPFPWREFWQHCIGTGFLARELIEAVESSADEADYLAGLIHDVGKIVMAAAFPEHFAEIHRCLGLAPPDLITRERDILGIDHAELGARYLERHNLPEALIETTRFHHRPEQATHHARLAAAIQIADLLSHSALAGANGDTSSTSAEGAWLHASGWAMLYPPEAATERALAQAAARRSVERLPTLLAGLV